MLFFGMTSSQIEQNFVGSGFYIDFGKQLEQIGFVFHGFLSPENIYWKKNLTSRPWSWDNTLCFFEAKSNYPLENFLLNNKLVPKSLTMEDWVKSPRLNLRLLVVAKPSNLSLKLHYLTFIIWIWRSVRITQKQKKTCLTVTWKIHLAFVLLTYLSVRWSHEKVLE